MMGDRAMDLANKSYEEQVGDLEAVAAKIDLIIAAGHDLPIMDISNSDPYCVRIDRTWLTWLSRTLPSRPDVTWPT